MIRNRDEPKSLVFSLIRLFVGLFISRLFVCFFFF